MGSMGGHNNTRRITVAIVVASSSYVVVDVIVVAGIGVALEAHEAATSATSKQKLMAFVGRMLPAGLHLAAV